MGIPVGMRVPMGRIGGVRRGGVGIVGLLVIVAVALLFGVDPGGLIQGGGSPAVYGPSLSPAQEEEFKDFSSVVLADTEDTWQQVFAQLGDTYRDPKMVLFTGAVQSACGGASAAMGPFYCPGDQRVYLDLSFFQELQDRFQATGDFAQAYVIAHEVGHHVQNLLGITEQAQAAQSQASEAEANEISVRVELQADCFAGVWANHAQAERQILEPGDVEEALNAASAIGDDRLQMEAQGYVVPDAFTHGTSAQRAAWFRRGFESGRVQDCDTFSATQL